MLLQLNDQPFSGDPSTIIQCALCSIASGGVDVYRSYREAYYDVGLEYHIFDGDQNRR